MAGRRAIASRSARAVALVALIVGSFVAGGMPPAAAVICAPIAMEDDYFAVPFGQSLEVTAPGLLANDTGTSLLVQTSWGLPGSNPDPSDDYSWFGDAEIRYGEPGGPRGRRGGFTYTPNPTFEYSGEDQFDYWVIDPCNEEDIASAYVTVVPIVAADSYATPAGVALAVPAATGVLANDKGVEPSSLFFDPFSANGGDVDDSGAGDGSFVYTPPDGFVGVDTFVYTVDDLDFANNYEGTVSITVGTPGVPSAPANVTAVGGDRGATVSFAPANANGSAIVSYTVTSTPGGFHATGAASPISIEGLSNATSYTFTVHATNTSGNGPESVASNPVVPAGPPGAPTQVIGVAGDQQATVSFVAPDENGAPITSYTVTCTSSDGGVTASAAGAASPVVVPGLTSGATYTCTASASNAAGTGASSTPSNAVVPVGCAGACISVGDRSMHEGDSTARSMLFPVTLSSPASTTVTVQYTIVGDSQPAHAATGGTKVAAGVDFKRKTGTLSFKPNARTQLTPIVRNISVPVYGDTAIEADETYTVILSNPSSGYVVARSGTGTIINDDGPAEGLKLGVGDTSIPRAASGRQNLTFAVTLSGSATTAFSVRYMVSEGGATYSKNALGGGSYGGKTTGILNFPVGAKVKTISVPIWPDQNVGPSKTFSVSLSELSTPGITLIGTTATATILR